MDPNPVQPSHTIEPLSPAAVQAIEVRNGFISLDAWADEERDLLIGLGMIGGVAQTLWVKYNPNRITEESRRFIVQRIDDEADASAPEELATWIKEWGLQGPLTVRRMVDEQKVDANGKPLFVPGSVPPVPQLRKVRKEFVLCADRSVLPINGEVLSAIRSKFMGKILNAILVDVLGEDPGSQS